MNPEVIRLAVVFYIRYPHSLRNVEVLALENRVDVWHETCHRWWNRFAPKRIAFRVMGSPYQNHDPVNIYKTCCPSPGVHSARGRKSLRR